MHYLSHTFGHYPYAIDNCFKRPAHIESNFVVMLKVSIVNIETWHERQAEAYDL